MDEARQIPDRNKVLDDVRRALGRTATVAPAPLDPFIEPTVSVDVGELIARFTEEATAVRAQVHRLNHQHQLVGKIAEICDEFKETAPALSGAEIFAEMNLGSALTALGFSSFVPGEMDHDQMVARLASCGVGVTAAGYAIAETGTIVLSSDEPNALLVSLLPPVHIAILRSSQIAASLDEVISKLSRERINRAGPSRSVTMITGPSRTSDVELVLSIGVHGPKELHVIILD
jgi:L-lactate dehydrogenase complex protein LldG